MTSIITLLTFLQNPEQDTMPSLLQPIVEPGSERRRQEDDFQGGRVEERNLPRDKEEVVEYYCCSCKAWEGFTDENKCWVCGHTTCRYCLSGHSFQKAGGYDAHGQVLGKRSKYNTIGFNR
jgi:hypothetical protein